MQEAQIDATLKELDIDLIVLARYMQACIRMHTHSLRVLTQCMLAVLLVCATKLCMCRALHARALRVRRDRGF